MTFLIKSRSSFFNVLLAEIVFIFLSATIIFALYFLIVNSLKTLQEFSINQFTLPKHIYLDNFINVFTKSEIRFTFRNSIFYCVVSVIISLFVSIFASFSFSFFNFKGKKIIFKIMIAAMYISPMAIIIPLYLQMSSLNLTDSYTGIIIIYVGITLAYSIYLITTFFRNIPREIIEAAIVDGCSSFGLLRNIYLPLTKIGLIVICVINFSVIWTDILFAFIFLQNPQYQTIMVSVAKFKGGVMSAMSMPTYIAALLIATFPPVVLYLSMMKFFRQGIFAGSIK